LVDLKDYENREKYPDDGKNNMVDGAGTAKKNNRPVGKKIEGKNQNGKQSRHSPIEDETASGSRIKHKQIQNFDSASPLFLTRSNTLVSVRSITKNNQVP